MCGIIGAIAGDNIVPALIEGLKRLEYRGYDSAGIAVIDPQNKLCYRRTAGKVQVLETLLAHKPLIGCVGIAHTRWATHGKPSEHNAHPQLSGTEVAVVHNGIIENHLALKSYLSTAGYTFYSETDTEVIAHLFQQQLTKQTDCVRAAHMIAQQLVGAFAIAFLHQNETNRLIGVRKGSPLVVGLGTTGYFLASDHVALLPLTRNFIYLEDGDVVELSSHGITIYDATGHKQERAVHTSTLSQDRVDKGHYQHYMQKEIFEQTEAVRATLQGCLTTTHVVDQAFGSQAPAIFAKIRQVHIVACGSSYHAGLVARHYLEDLAGLPCRVDIASEVHARPALVPAQTLLVTLSQSGETADTLNVLRAARIGRVYAASLAICNVAESTMVREANLVFLTRAGPEIGVASTKAFLTQLTALLLLTMALGRYHRLKSALEAELVAQLHSLPSIIMTVLDYHTTVQRLARRLIHKDHVLFIARGPHYPIALEAALKLKETAYIHAEACPAGELKHGPLALVDWKMPVIALAPDDQHIEKLTSNIQEVQARGGKLIIFASEKLQLQSEADLEIIRLPTTFPPLSPLIYTIPLQLLAYYVAVLKGTDVDQPRNLAKSVTVE